MHAVAPWDVHSCNHDCPGARCDSGATCERGARCRWANHVGARTRPRPARGLAGASPDAVRLRVVHPLASPPRWIQGYCSAPDGPPSQDTRIAPRDTTQYLLTSLPRDTQGSRSSLVRYRRMSSIAESADPACLACGGIAPKRTLWPLWTAGRSLTVIHTSPRASIVS